MAFHQKNMNKKGITAGAWMEISLFSVAFVLILAFVITGFDTNYSISTKNPTNYDPSFGLSNTVKTQLGNYTNLQDTSINGTNSGQVSNTATGLSVTSSWGILKSMSNLVWDLVGGGWINNTISLMQLGYAGTVLAIVLRILYVLSIILFILTVVFKVRFT
jgi:hypothetical protein